MSKKIKISATHTFLTNPTDLDVLICSFLKIGEIYNLTITASKFSNLLTKPQVLKISYQQTYPQQLYVKAQYLPFAIKRRYTIDRNMRIGKKTTQTYHPTKSRPNCGDPFFRSYQDKIMVYYDTSKYVQLLKKKKTVTVAKMSEGITDMQFDLEKIVCCDYIQNKLSVFDWQSKLVRTIPETNPCCFKIDDNILYLGNDQGQLKIRDFRTAILVDTIQIDNNEISNIVIHPDYVYLTSYTSKLAKIDRRMNTISKSIMLTPSHPLRFDCLSATNDYLITADGQFIAGNPSYYLIRIWDLNLEVHNVIDVDHKVNLSCDQHHLIYDHRVEKNSAYEYSVKIWSLDKNKKFQPHAKIKTYRPLNLLVNDNKIVTGTNDRVDVWDFE